MLIQRLDEFYDRIEDELLPEFHKMREVAWIIELDTSGAFRGFSSTTGKDGSFERPVPYLRRSGKSPPSYLLVDTPAYVLRLGLGKFEDKEKEEREKILTERNKTFIELVTDCANRCGEPALDAVVQFLTDPDKLEVARSRRPEDMIPGDLISFRVEDTLVFELPSVQRFWTDKMRARGAKKSDLTAVCLVCGEDKAIADRHPVELQVGPDRVQLITANENAFESYGLKASEIAPVCHRCAGRYGRALRYLLDSESHSLSLADTTHVFWTRRESDFDPWNLLSQADPAEVRLLLKSVFGSGPVPAVQPNEFYALSVSANTSRLTVRSWIETTVPQVKESLSRYFQGQKVVDPAGKETFSSLASLVGSTVRDFNRTSPHSVPALLRTALESMPLPAWMLHQALKRMRADTENRMTRPRAALMRLYFQSQHFSSRGKEVPEVTPELDRSNDSPAYLCGRLFSVLESIQRQAVNPKATITEKYFGTASSAPASVFGTLLRNAQSHMAKLRKEKKGAYYALDSRLQEVCSRLGDFPSTLSLQDQALFSLGYYHQKAADRAAAREASQKNANQ